MSVLLEEQLIEQACEVELVRLEKNLRAFLVAWVRMD